MSDMPPQMSDVPPPDFSQWPVENGNDVDRLLITADNMLVNNRRSTMVISVAIMRIVGQRRYGLRYLEHRYRTLQSATFLIAIPQRTAPAGLRVLSIEQAEMPYFLWINLNGQREADAKFTELRISYEENLARLDQTGFLMVVRH